MLSNRLIAISPRSLESRIRALFGNGEAGGWYDPSDLTTLGTDQGTAYQIPVVGQTIGVVLDKRAGAPRGAELLANGGFSAWSGDDPTGWTLDFTENGTNFVTQVAGGARFACDNTTAVQISQAGVLTAGSVYEVTVVCSAYVTGGLTVGVQSAASPAAFTVSSAGRFTRFLAPQSNTALVMRRAGVTDITIQSISCKLIAGNHVTQATSTKRMVLRQTAGGLYYLEWDGVDDGLATAADVSVLTQVWGLTVGSSPPSLSTFMANQANIANIKLDSATTWRSPTSNADAGDFCFGAAAASRVNGASGVAFTPDVAHVLNQRSNAVSTFSRIGRTDSRAAKGYMFGGIVIDRALTAGEQTFAERWCGQKCGVAL